MSNEAQGGPPTGQAAGKEMPHGTLPGDQTPTGQRGPDMHPGDEVPANAPDAGENICYQCQGSGKTAAGAACEQCGGTGRIYVAVSGGP